MEQEQLTMVTQDRRITILEENAKRFDRDLREVKNEMNNGFRDAATKLDLLNGKIDSLILSQAQSKAMVQGGWWIGAKIAAILGPSIGFVILAIDWVKSHVD